MSEQNSAIFLDLFLVLQSITLPARPLECFKADIAPLFLSANKVTVYSRFIAANAKWIIRMLFSLVVCMFVVCL